MICTIEFKFVETPGKRVLLKFLERKMYGTILMMGDARLRQRKGVKQMVRERQHTQGERKK